jgi:hypothetical protein
MNWITPAQLRERKLSKVRKAHRCLPREVGEKQALDIIRKSGPIMPRKLAEQIGVTVTMTRLYTKALIERGLIGQRYYRREYYPIAERMQ